MDHHRITLVLASSYSCPPVCDMCVHVYALCMYPHTCVKTPAFVCVYAPRHAICVRMGMRCVCTLICICMSAGIRCEWMWMCMGMYMDIHITLCDEVIFYPG